MTTTLKQAARVIAGDWCDATGDDHEPMAQGTYRFCKACGETLRGRQMSLREGRRRAQALSDAGLLGENVAGEAYQVIGVLADAAGLMDNPEVQRALDYFSGDMEGEILPFGAGLLAGGWRPISEAPKDGTKVMIWVTDDAPQVKLGVVRQRPDGRLVAEPVGGMAEWTFGATHFMPLPSPPAEGR